MKKTLKKSQADVLVTILLILIGITAVSIISVFVINLVKDNLDRSNIDCLDVKEQISFDSDNCYLKIEGGSSWLYFSISRDSKEFNLSGFNIVYGNDYSTKSLKVNSPIVEGLFVINIAGARDSTLRLPQAGETQVYAYNVTDYGISNINKIELAPIINDGKQCEKEDKLSVFVRA
jgi:hypothetical protein